MKKTALLALAAPLLALVAPAAHAAPVISYTTNVGGTFGNTDPTVTSGAFSDSFTFVTTIATKATIDLFSQMSTPTAWAENVNFISNGVLIDGINIPFITRGQFEQRSIVDVMLAAGSHTISVNGHAGVDGQYYGTISLISAVPDTSVWALLILGFGAVGGQMRRKRALITA